MSALVMAVALLVQAGASGPISPPDTAEADSVEDLAAHRLFFNPTARVAERGERRLGVFAFLVPYVSGVPFDRVEVTGAVPLFGLLNLADGGDTSFLLAGKLQLLDRGAVSAALGGLYFGNSGDDWGTTVAQGVVTVGNDDAALTVGLGRELGRGGFGNRDRNILTVGGEARVSPRLELLAESHFFLSDGDNSARVLFVGPRFRSDRATVDLAFWVRLNDRDRRVFPIPLVNVAWSW